MKQKKPVLVENRVKTQYVSNKWKYTHESKYTKVYKATINDQLHWCNIYFIASKKRRNKPSNRFLFFFSLQHSPLCQIFVRIYSYLWEIKEIHLPILNVQCLEYTRLNIKYTYDKVIETSKLSAIVLMSWWNTIEIWSMQ